MGSLQIVRRAGVSINKEYSKDLELEYIKSWNASAPYKLYSLKMFWKIKKIKDKRKNLLIYCSAADLTSSLESFPPRPEARSIAPDFDIVWLSDCSAQIPTDQIVYNNKIVYFLNFLWVKQSVIAIQQ